MIDKFLQPITGIIDKLVPDKTVSAVNRSIKEIRNSILMDVNIFKD